MTGIEPMTFRVLGGCDSHYTTSALVFKSLLSFYNELGEHPTSLAKVKKEVHGSDRVSFQVYGKRHKS